MRKKYFLLLITAVIALERSERSMLEDDPCLDANQIQNLDSIHVSARYRGLSLPWKREDLPAKIYSSLGLQYQWSWVEALPIRGLTPSTTIGDVIRWLDGKNCSFLATGSAVWETLHQVKPLRISGETSCSLTQLYSWCMEKFPAHSCGLYPLEDEVTGYRLEIGDARTNSSIEELRAEPLQLFNWGHMLSKPRDKFPFSVDAMAIYDNQAGQVYLVDLSGRGYTDICEKKINPAVNQDQWEQWGQGPVENALQFYQLRWQGFSSASHEFDKLVNKLIEEKSTDKDVQTFYCEALLGGVVNYPGDDATTTCYVVYPDNSHVKKIGQAREIMSHEMGTMYSQKVEPAIDRMEAVFVTAKQFVETRNRLKKRISSPAPRLSEPNLVLGEPLVGDISEVHRRPILSKGDAVTDLPPDFPSAPKAVPDQNGGFIDQHQDILQEQEPEGAGGGFQHETYGAGKDEEAEDADHHEPQDSKTTRDTVPDRRTQAKMITRSGLISSVLSQALVLFFSWFLF